MREVPLTRGYIALVDDEDYDRVSQFNWYAAINKHRETLVYAQRNIAKSSCKSGRTTQALHRFILKEIDPSIEIDHVDHNGLNCQKFNLRRASRQENQANARKQNCSTTSKYKGVTWNSNRKRWCASVYIRSEQRFLGTFTSEKEAARAYDTTALALFGEFACTNKSLGLL